MIGVVEIGREVGCVGEVGVVQVMGRVEEMGDVQEVGGVEKMRGVGIGDVADIPTWAEPVQRDSQREANSTLPGCQQVAATRNRLKPNWRGIARKVS